LIGRSLPLNVSRALLLFCVAPPLSGRAFSSLPPQPCFLFFYNLFFSVVFCIPWFWCGVDSPPEPVQAFLRAFFSFFRFTRYFCFLSRFGSLCGWPMSGPFFLSLLLEVPCFTFFGTAISPCWLLLLFFPPCSMELRTLGAEIVRTALCLSFVPGSLGESYFFLMDFRKSHLAPRISFLTVLESLDWCLFGPFYMFLFCHNRKFISFFFQSNIVYRCYLWAAFPRFYPSRNRSPSPFLGFNSKPVGPFFARL